MLDNLAEPREKLIYAFALLRGYRENCNVSDIGMTEALDDVMDIIEDILNNTTIYKK